MRLLPAAARALQPTLGSFRQPKKRQKTTHDDGSSDFGIPTADDLGSMDDIEQGAATATSLLNGSLPSTSDGDDTDGKEKRDAVRRRSHSAFTFHPGQFDIMEMGGV